MLEPICPPTHPASSRQARQLVVPAGKVRSPPPATHAFEQFCRREGLLEGERCKAHFHLLDFSGPIKCVSWIDLLQSPISNCYSSHASSRQTSIPASTVFFPAHLLRPKKCPNGCHIDSKPMTSSRSPPFTRQ